jgi:hypothetical protein
VDLAGASAGLHAANAHLLDASVVTLDGLRVGGVSGAVGRSREPWQRGETDFAAAVESVCGSRCDVLVLHDGPNVAGTQLPGWPCVRHVIERGPRMLVVRGHDHWPQPLARLSNGTEVVNTEGRVIIVRRLKAGVGCG